MRLFLIFVICFRVSMCSLWPKGVVHFAINKKDYDIHSQDVIMSTFAKIQSEICVKFFNTPTNYTATQQDKILYISNPDKRKDCPPDHYDFSGSVVDMPIGYRCINEKDIARIAVDMLRASIAQTVTSFNSYDLIQKFKERDEEVPKSSLLPSVDRNYINAHYHTACGDLNKPVGGVVARRAGDEDVTKMSGDNEEFYERRRWPLGMVMYGLDPTIPPQDEDLNTLNHAMTTIELATCIVFQRITETEVLEPNNYLWFTTEGEELPHLGFYEGKQTLKLSAMTRSAPGHSAHALSMLLRVIGVPMMSNRFDRDNYVTIDWKNVEYGKEHYLEKVSKDAWLKHLPYDFSSATHAPANYACRDCKSPTGAHTVIPVQDLLWQKTLSMGHRIDLSESDIQTVNFIYEQECDRRAMAYKFT